MRERVTLPIPRSLALLPPPPMYSFSLVSAVNMMWESQTYWLAVLIVIMSGMWVYIVWAVESHLSLSV